MQEIMELEERLERDMMDNGYRRFMAEIAAAKDKGREGDTVYGSLLIRQAIAPVSEGIAAFLEGQAKRTGPKHIAAEPLSCVHPDVAALITMRVLIDKVSKPSGAAVATAAVGIGIGIETEIKLAAFEDEYRPLFKAVTRDLDSRTAHQRHRRATLLHVARKTQEMPDEIWPQNFRLHVGMALLSIALEQTGLFNDEMVRHGKQTKRIITATPKVLDLIGTVSERAALLSPSRLPMVVEPKPWSSMNNGGYYYMPPGSNQMVKVNGRNSAEEVNNQIPSMASAIEALNVAQSTPFSVNEWVLAVAKELWESNATVGGLARFEPLDLPPKPLDIATNEAARKRYSQEASAIHSENRRSLTKRLQTATTLSIAEQYLAHDRFYFPHEFDFRGRMYPTPAVFNPQAGDLARGLMQFADGLPFEDGTEGCRWWMIHGANMYGLDKETHDDRVEWVVDNHDRIMDAFLNPCDNEWWQQADEPWQFLAWVNDYANWCINPDHKSKLIVAMDGSCNGLQHFSAMLRDEVGGAAVNLLPSAHPADVYATVADKVVWYLDVIQRNPGFKPDEKRLAAQWEAYGVDRKVTKRPVMVLPYGGTMHAMRRYIEDAVVDQGDSPWGAEDMWQATYFLARVVWDAIAETVVAARKAMDWLQETSKVVADAGLPLVWTMPDGFPVFQNYVNTRHQRVKTKLGDRTIKVSMYSPLTDVDRNKQSLATSPNFVHSYDALALRHYILIASDNGIQHFATVHDSYGVHAANAAMSAACLREAFVNIYSSVDPLARLDAEVRSMLTEDEAKRLPPLPAKGNLNIEEVRNADHFFS